MSSKRVRTSSSKVYLDVEAMVDDDGEESAFESDTDSIVDDVLASTGHGNSDISSIDDAYVRWMGSKNVHEEANALNDIARDIEYRYSKGKTNSNECHELDVARYPTPTDPGIWRVKVQVGMEWDIVFQVFEREMERPSSERSLAISVVARDSIRGYVYVEAMNLASVSAALVSIPGIRYSRHGSLIADLVSTDDCVQLMRMETLGVKKNTWVRITKKGSYFGDLAFVYDLEITEKKACVLLVPRIRLDRKRKHQGRPSQSLFDKSAVERTYGADSIHVLNINFFFKRRCYKHGLLDIDYQFCEVSGQPVDPTRYDLTHFRQSDHPTIIKALKSIDAKLYVGDRIQVLSGTYQTLRGRLIAISDQNTVTVQADDSEFGEFEVMGWEISRFFHLGDGVAIHGGDYSGQEGYVVAVGDDTVVVFVWNDSTQRNSDPGREVIVESCYVHANSSSPKLWARTSNLAPTSSSSVIAETMVGTSMYTGRDHYRHMEVVFVDGHMKGHFGAVTDYQDRDGALSFTVRTTSQTISHVHNVKEDALRERYTRLPLSKAVWVPVPKSAIHPDRPAQDRPSTPMPSPLGEPGTLSPAWDPSADTPVSSIDADKRQPGEWLLDERLLHKRLDIRIEGTTKTLFRNGRYDNQSGFLVLTNKPSSVNTSVTVKIGYRESQLTFPVRYIIPETTTERDGFDSTSLVQSIVLVPGERVVIIGPDAEGVADLVGNYAVVIQCVYPLLPGQACVMLLTTSLYGQVRYFFVDSLCRSTSGSIEWSGILYQ